VGNSLLAFGLQLNFWESIGFTLLYLLPFIGSLLILGLLAFFIYKRRSSKYRAIFIGVLISLLAVAVCGLLIYMRVWVAPWEKVPEPDEGYYAGLSGVTNTNELDFVPYIPTYIPDQLKDRLITSTSTAKVKTKDDISHAAVIISYAKYSKRYRINSSHVRLTQYKATIDDFWRTECPIPHDGIVFCRKLKDSIVKRYDSKYAIEKNNTLIVIEDTMSSEPTISENETIQLLLSMKAYSE
jgi:hypothetical protein